MLRPCTGSTLLTLGKYFAQINRKSDFKRNMLINI